ncbi:MAG: hypothetical protein U1E78_07775 [Gammaproteobacteria bacterium]
MIGMNPRTIDCVIFESAKVNYILPKNIIKEIIPIEKTAIFLKLKGLIIGRQRYQSETVPIINLQSDTDLSFSNFYHKLLVLYLIHPQQAYTMFAAILIDKDPTYVTVSEDAIVSVAQDRKDSTGIPVMVGSKKAIIPDLKYLVETLAKEM